MSQINKKKTNVSRYTMMRRADKSTLFARIKAVTTFDALVVGSFEDVHTGR